MIFLVLEYKHGIVLILLHVIWRVDASSAMRLEKKRKKNSQTVL